MARGGPDWSAPDYQVAVSEIDPADAADRITGFSRIDARGRIVFISTFREGLGGWTPGATGGGSNPLVLVDDRYAFAGPGHCYFDSSVVASGTSVLQRGQFLGHARRVSLELGIYFDGLIGETYAQLQYRATGFSDYQLNMFYNPGNGAWYVLTTGSSYQKITPNSTPRRDALLFAAVKLVADFSLGEYVRLLIGETEYDLSGVPMIASGIAEGESLIDLHVLTGVGGLHELRLTHVVMTKDEP